MLALPRLPCSARSRAVATHPPTARTHCRQVCRAAAQAPPVSAAAKQRRLGDSDLNISGAPVPQPWQPRSRHALSSRTHYSTVAYHFASLASLADVLVIGPQCACMSVVTIWLLFFAFICLTISCGWCAEVTLGTMTFGVQAS